MRANSDTPEDSERARRFGAQGIGLCRTEHMFLGDRRQHVERLILAESDDERQQALDALEPLQREDFVGIFRRWTACPSRCGCSTRRCTSSCPTSPTSPCRSPSRRRRARTRPDENDSCSTPSAGCTSRTRCSACAACASVWSCRGCSRMQVRAIAEAAAQLKAEGKARSVEIMVPLVGAVQELEIIRDEARQILAEVQERDRSGPRRRWSAR